MAEGCIDGPEKWARTDRVREFDTVKRDLAYAHLRGAPSVGGVTTAALAQDPNKGPEEFVYMRVKEVPTELVPRRGLARSAYDAPRLRRMCGALAVGGGLRAVPILPHGSTAVDAFSHHNGAKPTERHIVVAAGACQY